MAAACVALEFGLAINSAMDEALPPDQVWFGRQRFAISRARRSG
jgi:hypothetical protein